MESLTAFLIQAVVISLSGVMAPGPMTAAVLAAGTRSRHAGARMAIGHGMVEMPLMFLIMLGMGALFASPPVRIGIGLTGGAFLVFMGAQMMRGLRNKSKPVAQRGGRGPIWTGILLSAANPYFLLWWATVGLTLASQASRFGILAFALFAILHWLCDLVWLEALSMATFKGSRLMGDRTQRIALAVCAVALLFFGIMFIHEAAGRLIGA